MPQLVFAALALAPLTAVLVSGFERRWMDDDGFINLRVVRNLLHGNGPVFNLDERVEATTSPLWLSVLALLGIVGIRLEYAAVFAGIALTGIGLLLGQVGALLLPGPREGFLLRGGPRAGFGLRALPIGAAIFAALPPVWDYASSGLETGLGIAWMGACYAVLARRTEETTLSMRRLACAAMAIGIGPLIRPEFCLYVVAFLVPLTAAAVTAGAQRGRLSVVTVGAIIATSACALPVAYQIFRMGYYASVAPNTAIVKEAFLSNWTQGRFYFDNFFGTYKLVWPLAAAAIIWLARLYDHFGARRIYALCLTATPTLAASIHVAYLVRIGGDYMHGRLFVPAVFAGLLPVMMVPVSAPQRIVSKSLVWSACIVVVAWLPICALTLRVGVENVGGIGDERGWYARLAHDETPVTLESYRSHFFYEGAQKVAQRLQAACPSLWSSSPTMAEPGCRRVSMDEEKPSIVPAPANAAMARDVDARVGEVVSGGAIGMLGYLLPANIHVVDSHGLADFLVAHFELRERGRPGHEKKLSAAWLLARFSEPDSTEDASVTVARHALHCGTLSSIVNAVTAPLTLKLLLRNIAHAWAYSRLRIPADPFDAEAQSCEMARMPDTSTGGGGGAAFRWRCPSGSLLSRLDGSFQSKDSAISRVQPVCRGAMSADERLAAGPAFGEPSDNQFSVACDTGSRAIGIYGWSDNLVRSVGFICAKQALSYQSSSFGSERGHAFAMSCPNDGALVGIEGRSGALVDSFGILCTP